MRILDDVKIYGNITMEDGTNSITFSKDGILNIDNLNIGNDLIYKNKKLNVYIDDSINDALSDPNLTKLSVGNAKMFNLEVCKLKSVEGHSECSIDFKGTSVILDAPTTFKQETTFNHKVNFNNDLKIIGNYKFECDNINAKNIECNNIQISNSNKVSNLDNCKFTNSSVVINSLKNINTNGTVQSYDTYKPILLLNGKTKISFESSYKHPYSYFKTVGAKNGFSEESIMTTSSKQGEFFIYCFFAINGNPLFNEYRTDNSSSYKEASDISDVLAYNDFPNIQFSYSLESSNAMISSLSIAGKIKSNSGKYIGVILKATVMKRPTLSSYNSTLAFVGNLELWFNITSNSNNAPLLNYNIRQNQTIEWLDT